MKTFELPKTGLSGLKSHFKSDLIAGFSVSLIALPLCLGIAIASGVPPLAGLITAIVGGILASRIAGTFVTISGPAAGLIVITLGAVESMDYPSALGAIVIAGIAMVLFGLLKVGKIGDFFPSAAVHGMLAAIGIIIIIKQIFPAIGVAAPKGEILEVAASIPSAFTHINPYSISVASLALLILVVHPYIKLKMVKLIPAPMWVLLLTIPMAAIIGNHNLSMVEMPHHLFGEGGFEWPSFDKIATSAFWISVVSFALVSGIETMLSAKAVDSLDPYKRSSNLNKDLISVGAGSSIAAMIGGLPMISEIVRSSANVNSGAKTQWSNFFHGVFLLIYLLIGVAVIEMIPIAALSAMLVFTGFRLASPREFKHIFQIGLLELEIFIVTIIAVLATDLIIGILIGILFKYVVLLAKGIKVKELFKSNCKLEIKGEQQILHLYGAQIFSNYLSLKKKMDSALNQSTAIQIDFSEVDFVDHTVMEHLEDYARLANQKGKDVFIVNTESLNPVSNHPLAARDRHRKTKLSKLTIDHRTLTTLSFAQENGFEFLNILNKDKAENGYASFFTSKVTKVSNIIRFTVDQREFELADLETKSGELLTEYYAQSTVIKVAGFHKLPVFSLHKSVFADRIVDLLTSNEVIIKNEVDFTNDYTLISEEENEVLEHFFDANLIRAISEIREIHLVSNGHELLMYFGEKILTIQEMERLIDGAKTIVAEI